MENILQKPCEKGKQDEKPKSVKSRLKIPEAEREPWENSYPIGSLLIFCLLKGADVKLNFKRTM
jgi:hypothetical protein